MITAHAIVRPTSVLYNVFIIPSANGNVFISCFEQDTIGHKKLFHAPTNVKIDRAIIDDFTIGNTTLKKIRIYFSRIDQVIRNIQNGLPHNKYAKCCWQWQDQRFKSV